MDYRRWCWWAEWGLVAAVAGLHGVVFMWPEVSTLRSSPSTMEHDAQVMSGAALALGWIILGPGPPWLRVMAVPLFASLWFYDLKRPWEVSPASIVLIFCGATLLLGGLRFCGYRIAISSAMHSPPRGVQFSLLALILAITAVAAVLGALEALRPTLGSGRFAELDGGMASRQIATQVRMLVMTMVIVLSAIGGMWVVLRPGAMWIRLGVVVGLIPVSGLYMIHLAGVPEAVLLMDATSLAVGLATVAGLCGVSVLPLRLMGFRLVRQSRSTTVVWDGKLFTLARALG